MAKTTVRSPGGYLLLSDGTRWPAPNITINSDVERVYVANAWKPDEKWEQTDSHGHTHRYVRDEDGVPRLPSLEPRAVNVECDGMCGDDGCDGYTITEWFCRECGDKLEPGFVHDYAAEMSGVPVASQQHYMVTVEASPEVEWIEGAVYVYADNNGGEDRYPLPPLSLGAVHGEGGLDGWTYTAELHGYETKAIDRKPTGP